MSQKWLQVRVISEYDRVLVESLHVTVTQCHTVTVTAWSENVNPYRHQGIPTSSTLDTVVNCTVACRR